MLYYGVVRVRSGHRRLVATMSPSRTTTNTYDPKFSFRHSGVNGHFGSNLILFALDKTLTREIGIFSVYHESIYAVNTMLTLATNRNVQRWSLHSPSLNFSEPNQNYHN